MTRLCTSALAGLALLISALSMPAHAQPGPKTITLVVPFAAGGGTDTVARLIGADMVRVAKLVESSGIEASEAK